MTKILMVMACVSVFGLSWSGTWLVMDAFAKDQSIRGKTVEQCHQQIITVPYPSPLRNYLRNSRA